jgi:Flp pilus assembly protein TadG
MTAMPTARERLRPGGMLASLLRRCWCEERAAQIVEFALSLPLLVLFVVGIFDFSGALALKQKLTNAAREGARIAAADPASDMYTTAGRPVSVNDAFQVVNNYLLSEKISDCGLPGTITSPQPLTWQYTNNTGCPGTGMTLTINRGCLRLENNIYLVGTCVTIQYAYNWRYGKVAGLLGGTVTTGAITTTAMALNEN